MQLYGSLSILWHCLSFGLEWKLTFSSPVDLAEFSKMERNHKDQAEINEIEMKKIIEKINETKTWFFENQLKQWQTLFSWAPRCSVMSDSVTTWIAARQASLSITNSRSSLKLTSIKSMMPSSHPLSSPSPPAPNPSQHQSLFQWVNSSHEVAKVLEFQL